MKRIVIVAALAAAMPFAVASAAGPFDGQYTGGSPRVRGATVCPVSSGTVTVVDGKLTGKFTESRFTFTMTGTVAPDGTVTGKFSAYPMKGKFTAGHFEGSYDSKECGTERPITLDKAG